MAFALLVKPHIVALATYGAEAMNRCLAGHSVVASVPLAAVYQHELYGRGSSSHNKVMTGSGPQPAWRGALQCKITSE